CTETPAVVMPDTSFIEIPLVEGPAVDSTAEANAGEPTPKTGNQPKPVENPIQWRYYPNPTSGILTIEMPGEVKTLYITDLSGKIIQRYTATNDALIHADLSNFAVGTYFIKGEYAADKWVSGKVVLVR